MVIKEHLDIWTYASASSVTAPGDWTGTYWPGMRVVLKQGTLKYFVISSVVYSSPNTTITLDGFGIYSLVSATITAHIDSTEYAPKGFPYPDLQALIKADYDRIGLGTYTPAAAIDIAIPALGDVYKNIKIGLYLRIGFMPNGWTAYSGYNAILSTSDANYNKFIPLYNPGKGILQTGAFDGIINWYGIDWASSNAEKIWPTDFILAAHLSYDGDFWVGKNCSALSFTDRTDAFVGDALAEIKKIKATSEGKIDHETLPEFARHLREEAIYEDVEVEKGVPVPVLDTKGLPVIDKNGHAITKKETIKEKRQIGTETKQERNIGNMVSILTTGTQQLIQVYQDAIEERNKMIADLTKKLETIEERLAKLESRSTTPERI